MANASLAYQPLQTISVASVTAPEFAVLAPNIDTLNTSFTWTGAGGTNACVVRLTRVFDFVMCHYDANLRAVGNSGFCVMDTQLPTQFRPLTITQRSLVPGLVDYIPPPPTVPPPGPGWGTCEARMSPGGDFRFAMVNNLAFTAYTEASGVLRSTFLYYVGVGS